MFEKQINESRGNYDKNSGSDEWQATSDISEIEDESASETHTHLSSDPLSTRLILPQRLKLTAPTTSLETSNTPPLPTSQPECHISRTEQKILELIDKSSDSKVLLSHLPELYHVTYKAKLPYEKFGHRKLKPFLTALQNVSVVEPGLGLGYVCRAAKEELSDRAVAAARKESSDIDAREEEMELIMADMKAAASTLTATKMHLDIIAFLAQNPGGTTGSAVRKEVVGLDGFVEDCAHEMGRDVKSFSPNRFLCHCEGVTNREVDGRNLLFLSCSLPQDAPSGNVNQAPASTESRHIPVSAVDIKAAALKLSGKKLHREILTLLEENPSGMSGSQVAKNIKNLQHYIKQCAQDMGRAYFSPNTFLSHVEGVIKKEVAGRNLFFLVGMVPQVEPVGYGGQSTSDGAAAVELLRLLDRTYRGRPWPHDKKELRKALSSLDLQSSAAIISWLEQGIENDLSDSKKDKEALKRAMHHFKKMGCLGGTNKAFLWYLEAVSAIVGREDIATALEPIVASDNQEQLSTIKTDGNTPVIFVDTVHKLKLVQLYFPFNPSSEPTLTADYVAEEDSVVAIDCEGVPKNLFLIQVGVRAATYVFDCVKLGAKEVSEALAPLLTCIHTTKLFHDLHNDAVALSQIGGVAPLSNTLDTQLAIEALTGDLHIGFNQMLQQLGHGLHPLKQSLKHSMDGGQLFAQRPLPADALEYAALDVSLLLKAKGSLFSALGSKRGAIQRASDTRALLAPDSGGLRHICFDVANSYSISSFELMQQLRPDDMLDLVPLNVSNDTGILLALLPEDLHQNLVGQTQDLSDIVLDKGREPLAWIKGDRVHLGTENRTVSRDDIDGIVKRVGGFGGDNRAGLERQLHRVSAMRNRQQDIIGLTLRVGRHVSGNATMISDLMFADCTKSILFLGEPGSGKTTVVREVTKQLADRFNVCIVDTSNEIAGDGDIPHPCVGYARRMMVPSLDQQSGVMIECVQNHTPEVMIIDEIGRPTEVEAARTCKQRGVRLIASAHGDLRKLIRNPKLRGLVGGVETVTLGDAQAKEEAKKSGNAKGGLQKLKAQRAGPPTFDLIVELRRGAQHEWRIVLDVGTAVDKVLEGQHYKAQRRTRNPLTGALTLELEMA